LREDEESGQDDSSLAFWRRIAARRSKGKWVEPYYRRVHPQPCGKKCMKAKLAKLKAKRAAAKKQFVTPEWLPPKPVKCKKGEEGDKCRLIKKLMKLLKPRDLSVIPEYESDAAWHAVEYIANNPRARVRVRARTVKGRPRFFEILDDTETDEEEETEETEAETEEGEADAEAEVEAEAEIEEELNAEAEAEADSESDVEAEGDSEETEESESEETAEDSTEEESEVEDTTSETDAAVEQSETEEGASNTAAATEEEVAPTTDSVTEADAETSRFAEVDTGTETEAEAVSDLKAAKWGEHTVEAEELTAFDKLMAQHTNKKHVFSTKKFKTACVKGDHKCLKKAQTEEARKLKQKMKKLTNKPTILKPLKLTPKKVPKIPEFLTPQYMANNDFVKPEYLIPKNKAVIGLPVGWTVPQLKRKLKMNRK